MRRRRLHRRERKLRNKKIIITSICLVCLVSVGFAAFQTQINLKATGNIGLITIDKLKSKLVTTGDGLYKSSYEDNRYIFRGSDPNNYIEFNNETWRILSIESDNTLKIQKEQSIGEYTWDATSNRDSTTSTYCTNAATLGCNAWAKTTSLSNTSSTYIQYYPNGNSLTDNTTFSGTVTEDASLNTYLNNDYYNSLLTFSKQLMVNGVFDVSSPGTHDTTNPDEEDMATNITQTKLYRWTGKVGLINVLEVMQATTTSGCESLLNVHTPGNTCATQNWTWRGVREWTISPGSFSHRGHAWALDNASAKVLDVGTLNLAVRPIVYLNSNITLTGKGTVSNPYIPNLVS